MNRLLALLPAFLFLVSTNAKADYDSTRKALEEKLYDIQTLVKTGINYDNYERQMIDLKILLGRFKRDYEQHNFSDDYEKSQHDYLPKAANNYIEAESIWATEIDHKASGYQFGAAIPLEVKWKSADDRLEYYRKNVSNQKQSSQTKNAQNKNKKQKYCTAWENKDGVFVEIKSKCD